MQMTTKWIASLGACALLGALALPWSFGSDFLESQAARQISIASGLNVTAKGGAAISFLPSPQLKLRDVGFRDPTGTLDVTAPIVKGKLRLLPLIAGRLELEGLALQSPLISLDIEGLQQTGKPAASATGSAAAPAEPLRLGTISITGGRALVRNSAASHEIAEFSGINLMLDWQSAKSPAAFRGQVSWRGVTLDLTSLLAKPGEILSGQGSPFTLELQSALGKLALDGALTGAPRWQFAGQIRASTHNAADVLEVTRIDLPMPGRTERVNLTAQSRIHANAISLANLKLELDKNSFDGALNIINDEGRPGISGTLASPALNFDLRSSHLPQLFANGDWSQSPLQTSALSKMNMDLRLSTNRLQIGQHVLADVAISSIIKDSRMEMSLSSSKSYSGTLKARLSLIADQHVPQARTILQFDKINAAAFFRDTVTSQRFEGIATGEAEFRSKGLSIHEMIQHSQGMLRTEFIDGAINGLDMNRALRQAQTQPLTLPSDIRSGRTPFRKAQIAATLEAGIIAITQARAEADNLNVAVTGTISLPAKSVNLDIDARRPVPLSQESTSADTTRSNPPSLQLDLTGPWENPSLQIDAESLINNSAAAAPLLRQLLKPGGLPVAPVNSRP